MVVERSNRIGCAATDFEKQGKKMFYLVCNYSVANINGVPTYQTGAPASDCKSGVSSQYPGLCSASEEYTQEELKALLPSQ